MCRRMSRRSIAAKREIVEDLSLIHIYELLGESDLISLHCPLTEETYHMINIDAIERMPT